MKRNSKQKTSKLKWTDFERKKTLKSKSFKTNLIRCERSKRPTTEIKTSKSKILQNNLRISDRSSKKNWRIYKISWLRLKKQVTEFNQTMIMTNDNFRRSFKKETSLLSSFRANSKELKMIIQMPIQKSKNLRKKFSQRMNRSMQHRLRTENWSHHLSLKLGTWMLKFKREILESDP